ncbi:hypothetical protein QTJ16_005520 [Diplocarpon rosae]|uniref:Protein root UVB sensitive/RUS domain-containing protein n=1 Tax=Diplocarpon rosae TaxID=946125 RepID=A0AAD9SX59_9HELO|nr:hypothetical protein QTJ16_005520 [Diplocarpon rosae]PBP18091.1 DUF647 domain-containing protein [Diplocarpon rosae]
MVQKQISESIHEIEEIDQAKNVVATYIRSSFDEKGERVDIVTPKNANSYARTVLNAFLPAGYPNSVTDDYLEYQIYDSLQAFSSSIAGMLSSRAVLEGIGVGNSSASPTTALLLTVLQESMGRIATILFAHRLGTSLEPECKMYRLAADVFNDAAMILDCLSPALPKTSRVVLLSLSSVLRALCGVAAGSSKASLSAHFATQGNLGELNAKDSSQETVISLLGMLVGSIVVSHITSKATTWIALTLLLAVHLGTNYLAVRAVCMRTLNRQRANLVFSHILQQLSDAEQRAKDKSPTRSSRPINFPDALVYPNPEEIKLQERVFERDGVLRWNGGRVLGYCKLGVSLQTLLKCFSKSNQITGSTVSAADHLTQLCEIFNGSEFLVWFDEPRMTFLVVLKDGSDARAPLSAWMFALCFARRGKSKEQSMMDALKETLTYMNCAQPEIFRRLEHAWDLEKPALETKSGTRIRLKKDQKD